MHRSQTAHLSTSGETSLAHQQEECLTTFPSPVKINVPKGITIYKSNNHSPFRTPDKDQFQRPAVISRSLSNSPAAETRNNFLNPRQQLASSISPTPLSSLTGISVSSGGGQGNRPPPHFNPATARRKPPFRKQPKTLNETVISLAEKAPQMSNNGFAYRGVTVSKNVNNDSMTSAQTSSMVQGRRAMPKNMNNDCVILTQPSNSVQVGPITNRLQSCDDVVVEDVIELDSDDDEITIVEPSSSDQFQVPLPGAPLAASIGSTPGKSKKTPKVSPRRSDLPPSLYQRERPRQNLNSIFESACKSESSKSCQFESEAATTATSTIAQMGGSISPNQSSVNNICDKSTANLSNDSVATNPPQKRIVKVLVDDTNYQALINLGFEIVD